MASSTPFLESSYVYIVVVGVLAVVPIVMGIVLFKKAREKKRKVQYCRGGLLCPGVRERECVCACVRVYVCTFVYVHMW